jgi:hypothetical protein
MEGWVTMGTGVYAGQSGTVEARFDNLAVRVRPVKTAPVAGEVAYRDEFDDPDASQLAMENVDSSTRRFDIIDGEYVIEKIDPDLDSLVGTFLPGAYRDAVVAVDVRLVGATENRSVYLTCRDESSATGSTYYFVSVEPGDASFQFGLREKDEATNFASGVRQDAITPGNAVNRIELRCIGDEITAVINGVEVARVEDGTLTEGRISIRTGLYAGEPGTVDARFDNLVVTSVNDAP